MEAASVRHAQTRFLTYARRPAVTSPVLSSDIIVCKQSARCSQTRVRPHRASVRPWHGRGLASAPAEDWTRPVVPWYGRVEHHMVLRIPSMDNLETPPPQLGVYVGPFSRVSRLSFEGILRTIWHDFRVLSPVLHTSGCVRVVKHLVNPWMSCVNTYAVRT